MNYQHFIWMLPLLSLSLATTANAVEMSEDCINEPIFNGRVCVYQANPNHEKSIFLIHGIGDNASRDWNNQLSTLAEHFHILTFDLPGFGRSEKGDKLYSPDKYAELIDFIAAHYAIREFDLVGHSMGAGISIVYASKFPEKVKKLVLVDAAGILHRLAIGKYFIADAMAVNKGRTDTIEPYVIKVIEKFENFFDYLSEDIAKQNEHTRAGIELVDYNFGPDLENLNSPTLIVWGEKDHIAPLRTAKVLYHRIKNSRLEVIKGAGHLPMKNMSEEFNLILMGFLQTEELKGIEENTLAKVNSKKLGRCDGKRGASFSGDFRRLVIANCSNVKIINANIDGLYVFESRLVIEDSSIGGDVPVAIESIGSDIKMTSSKVKGSVAIKTARSRFDMAAVDINYRDKAIVGMSKSQFIFSVCRIMGKLENKGIHDYVTLKQGGDFSTGNLSH